MKHTPGPWREKYFGAPEIWADNVHIADVCACDEHIDAPTAPITQANARAISALPELLAALKAIDTYWRACAESAKSAGACDECIDGHPNIHKVDDAPDLQKLCNIAFEKTHSAIIKAEGGE